LTGDVTVRVLNRYITKSFLVTFLATVVVFTFVLSIGGVFKLTDLVSKGVPWLPILKVFGSGMPSALAFAIPISALTATLLVFGRLSADSEISAMSACGISLWQIMGWIMPSACLMAGTCLYVNNELVPYMHYVRRSAVVTLETQSPIDLIEVGRPIDAFAGLTIFVGKKINDRLGDIRIYDLRTEGQKREIKAKHGTLSVETNSNDIILELEEVTIDPFSFENPAPAYCGRWTERIQGFHQRKHYRKRDKDRTFRELIQERRDVAAKLTTYEENIVKVRTELLSKIHNSIPSSMSCFPSEPLVVVDRDWSSRRFPFWVGEYLGWWRAMQEEKRRSAAVTLIDQFRQISDVTSKEQRLLKKKWMKVSVELHKRCALSCSCIAFVFLGIPLGIRSHRKESSIGIALSLLLVFSFYLFIIVAEQLTGTPALHPDLLTWMPVVLSLSFGSLFIQRMS
jgi:lipopolysaccharide export LptBFGC system permease protein LptF